MTLRTRATVLLQGKVPSAIEIISPLRAHSQLPFQLTDNWLAMTLLAMEQVYFSNRARYCGFLNIYAYDAGRPARRFRALSAVRRRASRDDFCAEVVRTVRGGESASGILDPAGAHLAHVYIARVYDPFGGNRAYAFDHSRCQRHTMLVVLEPVARRVYLFDPRGTRSSIRGVRRLMAQAIGVAAGSAEAPWPVEELPGVADALNGRGGAADGELVDFTGHHVPTSVWCAWAMLHWASGTEPAELRRRVSSPDLCLQDAHEFTRVLRSVTVGFLLMLTAEHPHLAEVPADGTQNRVLTALESCST